MTTRAELWAAVYRRKAEHAAGAPISVPDYQSSSGLPGDPAPGATGQDAPGAGADPLGEPPHHRTPAANLHAPTGGGE